jgi:hypothetical protein
MNELPPELRHALQDQRLLIVWGETPFELPSRVTGERVVAINRLVSKAAHLPPIAIRLSVTPPLPILSFDPTDRIEREFQASGRALLVVKSAQDTATRQRHMLIKLAGDLTSRAELILSRDELQRLSEDEDKRYLLDLVRQIVEGGAVIIVKDLGGLMPAPSRSQDDFQAWWSIVRPLFGAAPIFAAGEASANWPGGVTYLGSVQDVVDAAFANVKAPIPRMEEAAPPDASTAKGLPTEVSRSIGETGATASEGSTAVGAVQVGGSVDELNIGNTTTNRSGGVDVQGQDVKVGGDVVGGDKVTAGGHVIHAEPGSTVIINQAPSSPEPASSQPPMPIDVQTLRVDAAVPEQVFVDRVFDLAVAVRQMTSPPLAVKDLTHVESGEVQTTWEANTPLINLRAEVDAPDCAIVGKSSIQFRLARGKDAPPIYFRLKPLRAGELSIVVTVYQEDYALGSARVSTLAAEQAAQPAGKVELTVTSQPLGKPPQPIGRTPLSAEDRASLERQLQSARENLRLIEDRKAEYVLEVDVPLQLIKEERRLKERVAELERKLSAG